MAFGDGGAERGQIGFFEIAVAGVDVEAVAQLLGPAVHREVLAGGDGAQMFEVLALHAGHKGDSQAAGQERIFAVGLLAPPPARVTKDVDVGRPEREAVEDAVIAFPLRLVVLGAGLVGDDVAHALHHGLIPRRRHADRLGKHRGVAGARHPVQGFVPGLVVGNAEPRNRRGPVLQLVCLLLQGHAPHQVVGAFAGREVGIQVGGLLSSCNRCRDAKNQRREKDKAAKRHRIVPPELQIVGAQQRRPASPVVVGICRPTVGPARPPESKERQ